MTKQKSLSDDVLTIGVLLVLLILLSACVGNEEAPKPVGIGSDVDQYKRSPCACIELDQKPMTPGYVDELIRRLKT